MDHAYTLIWPADSKIQQTELIPVSISKQEAEDDQIDDVENKLEDCPDNEQFDDFEENADDFNEDDIDDEQNEGNHLIIRKNVSDSEWESSPERTWKVLLSTDEWMQMLPPQYLLHYIRERTVFRESKKDPREGRETFATLKRGWLRGPWRETLKEAISKQTDIPCVIHFNSSNFLKQPFSRKIDPPLWRVRACCRQDDGRCLRFRLKVQDFHPSQANVEVIIVAEGNLMTGPEGEARHTYTASDHLKVLKSLQRLNASQHQGGPSEFADASEDPQNSFCVEDNGSHNPAEDLPVERYELQVLMEDWISFLPPEAAEAYVLERSHVSKDRLELLPRDTWSRRLLAPRVTKKCRDHLKQALIAKTGLPCRISLSGRCHLKPPFSRKKRAPLFVINGFCAPKDNKCLRFKFTVQDFDPSLTHVAVDVEVRGVLLEGPEGQERHRRRAAGKRRYRSLQREAEEGVDADGKPVPAKRPRLSKNKERVFVAEDGTVEAGQELQATLWPSDEAEAVLDADADAGSAAAVSTIEVVSEGGQELEEDTARNLVKLANEALSMAGGSASSKLTKIVQSGDQIFIFLSDTPEENLNAPVLEGYPVTQSEVLSGVESSAVVPSVSHLPAVQAQTPSMSHGSGSLLNGENEPEDDRTETASPLQNLTESFAPEMEYHWEMQLSMVDWLRLLPAKSLRFYIHERTVSREVWVEEGWEKQFYGQSLQVGWRDVIRRALVDQTDIPCQLCFRGRSCLKLPFSRKHSAALWRTQAYCSKGEKKCLLFKMRVQDFHPDDEFVTVQVVGTGRLHPDCAKWYAGEGRPVEGEVLDERGEAIPLKQEPTSDGESELETDLEDAHDGVEGAEGDEGDDALPQNAEAPATTSTEVDAAQKLFQAIEERLVVLKQSLPKARLCPLRMQSALRLLQNAESIFSAPCKTADCPCRSPDQHLALRDGVRQALSASSPPPLRSVTRPSRSRPVTATSPPPLAAISPSDARSITPPGFLPTPSPPSSPSMTPSPPPAAASATSSAPSETPVLWSVSSHSPRVLSTSTPVFSVVAAGTPSSTVRLHQISGRPTATVVATSTATSMGTPLGTPQGTPLGPVRVSVAPSPSALRRPAMATPPPAPSPSPAHPHILLSKPQESTIIKLGPSHVEVRKEPVAPGAVMGSPSLNLVKLSTAIVRSAMAMPGQKKAAVPRVAKKKVKQRAPAPHSQAVVSSSDSGNVTEDAGQDPPWIMDEMRRVIFGGEENDVAVEETGENQEASSSQGSVATAPTVASSTQAPRPTIRLLTKSWLRSTTKQPVGTGSSASTSSAPGASSSPSTSVTRRNPIIPSTSGTPTSCESQINRTTASTPIARATASTPIARASASTPIARATASTPITRTSASTPVTRTTANTPITRATASTPITRTTANAPSTPTARVTRGPLRVAKVPEAISSSHPPPLVPISKEVSHVKVQEPAPSLAGRVPKHVNVSNSSAPSSSSDLPNQSHPVPARTVQTRRLTSVQAAKVVPSKPVVSPPTSFPKGSKVIILKPSALQLRSSVRKSSN